MNFVVITASWCGLCKIFLPSFDKHAEEYKDKATFLKVDAETSPEIVAKYKVDKLPVLLVICDGEDTILTGHDVNGRTIRKLLGVS